MVETTITSPTSVNDPFATATEKAVFNGQYSVASVIVTLSIALALYNSLELILLIVTTFKKWKGLYFWSLNLSNVGVILFALGMTLSYWEACVQWLWKTILDIGWVLMLTCQSLVLYSRLNLLVRNTKILSGIKLIIIFNSIATCSLVIVFDFGNTYSRSESFAAGYYYIEQIQLIFFTVQEMIISGVYVWKTLALLKIISKENTRAMIWQLLTINIIIICMDVAIVALQFLHYQLYQEALKCFVYSVKLKLELNILSKLVDFVNGDAARRSMTLDYIDSTAIAGQQRSSIKREMGIDPLADSDRSVLDEKVPTRSVEDACKKSSSTTNPEGSDDEITQITSMKSKRTSGRESDIMYADMLRSLN